MSTPHLEAGQLRHEKGPPTPNAETAVPPTTAAFDVPDGGLAAWSVVLGAWFIFTATFGYVNAFGMFQAYYISGAIGNVNASMVSWIGSVQLWIQYIMGLVVGKLFDEGYGKVVICVGSALFTFSLFMTSLCTKYWQVFLAQGVLDMGGIGLGIVFLPAMAVIPHWFQRHRAFATGIVVSGSSIGGIFFPIMFNNLIDKLGFANTVRATAYLILGCLVIGCVLTRPRLPARKHRPANMQFPPADVKAIVRHKAYLVTVAGAFFIMLGIFFPLFYIQVFAESHGLSQTLSFYLLAITNVSATLGRTIPSFLADQFGVFNMITLTSFVTSILIFAWLAATNTAGIVIFAILFGFCGGAFISLLPGIFQALSTNIGEIGVRMGIAWAIMAWAALVGTPITGALLGSDVDDLTWWRPTVFSGVVILVGSLFLLWGRALHMKERGNANWRI